MKPFPSPLYLIAAMLIFALLLFCAVSCAPYPTIPEHAHVDKWGYRYPAECEGSLAWVPTPVYIVTRTQLFDMTYGTHHVAGLCLHCSSAHNDRIYIANDLNEEDRRLAIHHERCHRAMWYSGKSVEWHN